MFEIALGVAFFTGIVLLLVLVILATRSRLVATGGVDLVVNDASPIRATVGRKLHAVLADADIHLPSACGGVGTCGQCRVLVLEGGGAILPTETALITRREAGAGTRLACQVTVRQDMAVRVPDEVFGVKKWSCTVRSNASIAIRLPSGDRARPRNPRARCSAPGAPKRTGGSVTCSRSNRTRAVNGISCGAPPAAGMRHSLPSAA